MDDAELLENAVELIKRLHSFAESIEEHLRDKNPELESEALDCKVDSAKFLSEYDEWSNEN